MKNSLTGLIIAALVTGCNSEQSAPAPQVIAPQPPAQDEDVTVTQVEDAVEQTPIEAPVVTIPATPLQPSIPVVTVPQPPTLPIFIGEGITTHTQQSYSGTITKGGDAYLRYNQEAQYFNDFELPEWSVTYRYEPFLEVLITNGSETLCARYSWKLQGFGYARPVCLWSDTRAAVPLEDMQSAYYGYSIVESRVWVNGVNNLEITVE